MPPVFSSEPMMVSANMAICKPDEPITAGQNMRKKRAHVGGEPGRRDLLQQMRTRGRRHQQGELGEAGNA